jgi:hypothetical protein
MSWGRFLFGNEAEGRFLEPPKWLKETDFDKSPMNMLAEAVLQQAVSDGASRIFFAIVPNNPDWKELELMTCETAREYENRVKREKLISERGSYFDEILSDGKNILEIYCARQKTWWGRLLNWFLASEMIVAFYEHQEKIEKRTDGIMLEVSFERRFYDRIYVAQVMSIPGNIAENLLNNYKFKLNVGKCASLDLPVGEYGFEYEGETYRAIAETFHPDDLSRVVLKLDG